MENQPQEQANTLIQSIINEVKPLRKKRTQTEKQKENIFKALAKRQENIKLRAIAKEKLKKVKQEKLEPYTEDNSYKENLVQELLELLLEPKTISQPKERYTQSTRKTESKPKPVIQKEIVKQEEFEGEEINIQEDEEEEQKQIPVQATENKLSIFRDEIHIQPSKPTNKPIQRYVRNEPVKTFTKKQPAIHSQPLQSSINIFRD